MTKSKTIIKAASLQRNASKRLTTTKHKKAIPPVAPATPKTTTTIMTQKKNHPWYNHFTKNDLLYNDYMANEWGMEKNHDDDQKNDNVLFENFQIVLKKTALSSSISCSLRCQQ